MNNINVSANKSVPENSTSIIEEKPKGNHVNNKEEKKQNAPSALKTYADNTFKPIVKSILPGFVLAKISDSYPLVGRIKWGDFKRLKPFNNHYGKGRGGPIDRYYVDQFLRNNSSKIKGRVLEIGDNKSTLLYGKDKIEKSDILHVHEGNPKATFVGDLADAEHIPSEAFDCILLVQTLHLIYDYKKALNTCYRILKPGGTLLLTVPGISQIEGGEWGKMWYWSFTERSMERIFEETFSGADTTIDKYGNVLTASAFLYGVGKGEVTQKELDYKDPLYQVLITVKATKRN
ncbi:MAG: methyltransferase domain-containing protein [Balneolales bacterium]